MASVVNDIINAALRKIGQTTIANLTDGTPNANWMNTRYTQVRDMCLERHPWNFAIKRAQLAQLASTPSIEFDYAYQLPADFLRAVRVHDNDEGLGIVDHKVEDGKVLTNSDQAWLIYIYRVTDPNDMSPLFREYVSATLAKEAAIGIVNSLTMHDQMRKEAERIERLAKSADAQGDLPDRMPIGSWVTSRTGRVASRKWSW